MLTSAVLRVLIVDDHPVVRHGVAAELSIYRDIDLIGLAANAEEAVAICTRDRPDIILLDVRLPDALAPEIVPRLLEASPKSKILLFTAFPEHNSVAPAFAAGACGLVVKDATAATLHRALSEVARTGSYRPEGRVGDPGTSAATVTPREYDVLRLVAVGLTNIEIGDRLHLSPNTVKAYLSSVMQKLQARNRAQVITRARAHGLL